MPIRTATFRWPPEMGEGSVTLRELTADETTMVVAAHNDPARGSIELVKRSLYEVDGQRVKPEDRDVIWGRFSAKQRALVQEGYRFLHIPTDAERDAFFASIAVGIVEQ